MASPPLKCGTSRFIYLCLEPCSWLWRCPLVREPDLLRCLLLLSLERERERRLSRDVERERLLLRSRERDLTGKELKLLPESLEIVQSKCGEKKKPKQARTFYALCCVIWFYAKKKQIFNTAYTHQVVLNDWRLCSPLLHSLLLLPLFSSF